MKEVGVGSLRSVRVSEVAMVFPAGHLGFPLQPLKLSYGEAQSCP